MKIPDQKLFSLAIAPPHLHVASSREKRIRYEEELRKAGADLIIKSMDNLRNEILNLFINE